MAQNSTISIGFKIESKGNGFHELSMDADGFRKIIAETVKEAKSLDKGLKGIMSSPVNFAAFTTVLDAVSRGFNELKSLCGELSSAYNAQLEAETKLAVNMRNTMGAREADIQSIKDLCSAQQQLGVIGDEVQLAGAQELATYLGEKESLEQLIPVMNDMLAQQYGLNASQENAANIATMLGKVMNGQTGALSRYGYTLSF